MKNLAFIFPGQGSQSVGMGRDFVENFDIAKKIIDQISSSLEIDFQNLLFEKNDKLNLTQFTQPAIFAVSAMAHEIFRTECGITPKIALGHSLGEVSAYCIFSGVSAGDAAILTHERGLLMANTCSNLNAGMMAVVGAEDDALENFCQSARDSGKKIWCANYNTAGQVVLAGLKDDLSAVESQLKEIGAKKCVLLPISVASHCPLLESMLGVFHALLDDCLKEKTSVQIVSNATLEKYDNKIKATELLAKQLVSPVRYAQSIAAIDSEIDAFIEFGNGCVLKGLNKRLTQKPTFSISDTSSLKEAISFLNS